MEVAGFCGAGVVVMGTFYAMRGGSDSPRWMQKESGPGVSPGRAGQLLAGALVAEAAMDLLGLDSLEIGPWALREGIILELLDGLDR